jgi:hypothetical protein
VRIRRCRPDRRQVAASRSSIRDRKNGSRSCASTISCCRCRAITTRSTPRRPSRGAISSACPEDVIRKALAGFGGVKRRFTKHRRLERRGHLRRLRPPPGRDRRRAARGARLDQRGRSSPWCSRIATRGCNRCSTNSPPASTTPTRSSSPMSTRRASSRSKASRATISSPPSRRAATATRGARKAPTKALAPLIRALARPGDYVVCLGAGNITQWAYALPGELGALRQGRGGMSRDDAVFARHHPISSAAMPDLRGRLPPTSRSAPYDVVPRRRAGAGSVLQPADEADLAYLLRTCRPTFRSR